MWPGTPRTSSTRKGQAVATYATHYFDHEEIREAAQRPMAKAGRVWWLLAGVLGVTVLFGLVAYAYQVSQGLGVTGLGQRVTWGFYISNLVFFIGISYGGALTSAILRLTGAPWRGPLVRLAEATAVAALLVGAVFPIVDLGRPDRFLNVILHGQVGSPVVWDVVAITTYLIASLIFLLLPLIPDSAVCRDELTPSLGKLRSKLYDALAMRWRGTDTQHKVLNQSLTVIAIIIIPLAISVHSVLAWLFGVTSRPGWDSTIFGPYFVLGAMYSGVGAVILVLVAFRRAYHLEAFITRRHITNLAFILLALAAGYLYFMVSEYLTEGYKLHETTRDLLELLMLGRLAPFFWLFIFGGLLAPMAIVALPITRNIPMITLASVAVVLGMWLKRFLIVVPGLAEPLTPRALEIYWPTWVEIAITLAAAAAIPLMLMVFFRFFPVLSIYEMEELHAHTEDESDEYDYASDLEFEPGIGGM
jgi:Ni/Fe-hydrogenase subunit HybB-like protein